MAKTTKNAIILKMSRFLILQRLMQKKTIREIATEIGV